MKRILFVFLASFFMISSGLAGGIPLVSAQAEKAEPIKPIKVSELNANLFSAVYDFLKETGSSLFEGFISLKDFFETGEWFVLEFQDPEMRDLLAAFGVRLMVSLFVAFAFAQGLSSWLSPKIQGLLRCKDKPVSEKQKKLILAALLSIVAPLGFGFFLYTCFRSISPPDGIYLEVVRILSSGAVTIWILLNLAHLFLRPPTAEHQHIPLSREILSTTYFWIRRMAVVALCGFFALETGMLIDLPLAGQRLLLQGSVFVMVVLATLMMVSLHEEMKKWIQLQRNNPQISKQKRAMLPYLEYSSLPIIVFIVISYMSWVTPELDRFQIMIWKVLITLALFPILRMAVYCLRKIRLVFFRRFMPRIAHRALFYGKQIDFMLVVLLNGGAILFILNLWGLNLSSCLFVGTGRLILEKAFSIFIIIVAALFITRTGSALLTKHLSAEKGPADETKKQRVARFKTISSISKNVLRIAVWTPAILLIVVELDIDIVPILATVGILSLGIGIGVQSLIKDFVTGFFMLLEDAFAVGDLVVINGQMGRIESLTVRVVRLRATDGALYTFPYGNITSLSNQNRDFSAVVILFQVGFDVDINQVFEMLGKISEDLQKNKKIRSFIMGSIEIDGVNEVNDHALEIRAVLKTKPSQHYKVKYAFNFLLKQYLESYKISPATPRQISFNYAVEK